MSGSRQRAGSGARGGAAAASAHGGGAGGSSNQQQGQPLVPPRVDPVDAMKRFDPFIFHIDTDTKDTTELRACFAALQRDAFVASNLFVLDRADVCAWFATLTDPALQTQIAEAKLHQQTLANFDAHAFVQSPTEGDRKRGGSSSKKEENELSLHDAGNLIALAYKSKILQLASEREMKLIKEEDERQEAFDQAVERFMEEGLSRDAAVAEATKEEEAARGDDGDAMGGGGGGAGAAGGAGAGAGAQSSPAGGASPGGIEDDIPGADGRNPTFVLCRGFPQTPDNVAQLAKLGIQVHSAFAINSQARLGKRDDPNAALLGSGGSVGADGKGGKSASSASGGASGKDASKSGSGASGAAGGKGSGGSSSTSKRGAGVPALAQAAQPVLSVSSAVKKEVLRVHPFRDHPLRHVHCWTYNVATAEGTRVIDEATGQKERILQESENDVADRVVSEVISVEAALHRYRQWVATKTIADQKLLEKEKERAAEAAAAAKAAASSSTAAGAEGGQQQPTITTTGATASSPPSSPPPSADANVMRKEDSQSSSQGQPPAGSSTSATTSPVSKALVPITTDLPFVHLDVPRLVDVAAEIRAKAAEDERQRILELHRAHEAAILASRGGRPGAASQKKLTGRAAKELADTSGLPEIPPAPQPPAPLPVVPTAIPHDSTLQRHILDSAPPAAASLPEVVLSAAMSQAAATAANTTELARNPSIVFSSQQHQHQQQQVQTPTSAGGGAVGAVASGGSATSIPLAAQASSASLSATAVSGGGMTFGGTAGGTAAGLLESSHTSLALPARSSAAPSVAGDTHAPTEISTTKGIELQGAHLAALEHKVALDTRDVHDFCDYVFACVDGEEESALEEIRKRRLTSNNRLLLEQEEHDSSNNDNNNKCLLPKDHVFQMVSELDATRCGTVADPVSTKVATSESIADIISNYNKNDANKKNLLQAFTRSLSVPIVDVKTHADLVKAATSMLTERCGFSMEDASNTVSRRTTARVWNASEATARLAQVTQNPDMSIRVCAGAGGAAGGFIQQQQNENAAAGVGGGSGSGCIAVVAPGYLEPNAFVPIQERKRFRVSGAYFGGTISFPEWMARRAYIDKEELFFNPPPSEEDDLPPEESDESSDEEYLDGDDDNNNPDNFDEDGQPRRRKKQKVKPPPEYVLFERIQTRELRRRAALELVRGMLQPGAGGSADNTSQALLAQNHAAFGVYGESTLMVTRDPNTMVRTCCTVGGSRSVDSYAHSGAVTASYHATLPADGGGSQQQLPYGADPIAAAAAAAEEHSNNKTGEQEKQQHVGGKSQQQQQGSSGRRATLTPGSASQQQGSSGKDKGGDMPTTPRQVMFRVADGARPIAAGHQSDNSDNEATPRGDTGRSTTSADGANNRRRQSLLSSGGPLPPLPAVVRVQANFGNDDAQLSALSQAPPVSKRSADNNGLNFSYFLTMNHSDDVVQFSNNNISNTSSSSSATTSGECCGCKIQVKRGSATRWARLPVYNAQTGELQFVESREVSRSVVSTNTASSTSSCSTTVQYHNGYSVTMMPDGSVITTLPSLPSTATSAAPSHAAAIADNVHNAHNNHNHNHGAQQQHHHHSPSSSSSATAAATASETASTTSSIVTTRTGHRLLLINRGHKTTTATSLSSKFMSTRITDPSQLPLHVEWRTVREDGVCISKLHDGVVFVEHADGTQFWSSADGKSVQVECWPAEPISSVVNNNNNNSFADPAKFIPRGPFSSPIHINAASGCMSFLCVKSGDLFVEVQPSAGILSTWLPTGQQFNIDTVEKLAHFRAVNNNNNNNNSNQHQKQNNGKSAEESTIRFVFDIAHGGLRGVDSLPDACPDGPSGLSEAMSLHVTPYGRTRIRKLAEDTHPPLDLDVTRPRQVIEQFALNVEVIHPPGVTLLPPSAQRKEALHMIQGPPPSSSASSSPLRRKISLQSVSPKIDKNLAAEQKMREMRMLLNKFFCAAERSSPSSACDASSGVAADDTNNRETSTTTSTSKRQQQQQQQHRPHPVDPLVFYILPDGRAIELLRQHDVPTFATAAIHGSDGVFSDVYIEKKINNGDQQENNDSCSPAAVVVCSVPKVAPSASFAAEHAALTRPYLSSPSPMGIHIATPDNNSATTQHHDSSCCNNNNSTFSRCANGPARSVADFLQRVHTYTLNPATVTDHQTNNSSTMTSAPHQHQKTIVATQVFATTDAASIIPECVLRGEGGGDADGSSSSSSSSSSNLLLSKALKSLHNAAPPLSWLEQGDYALTTSNASQIPLEPARSSAPAEKTQNAFTDRVADRKSMLASALGDGEAAHYFNPDSVKGKILIRATEEEHKKGEWKRLTKTSPSGRIHERGTRGNGFAHFAAAAEKLLEVGHGGMLNSPKHRERAEALRNMQQQNNKPVVQLGGVLPSSSSAPTSTMTTTTVAAPAAAVAVPNNDDNNKSQQQKKQQRGPPPPLARLPPTFLGATSSKLDASFGSSNNLLASSSAAQQHRKHIHARLVFEPSHIEFAPVHTGLRYHTSIGIINVGSSASRFRVKICELGDERKAMPSWLRAEVPHVRLGPGMRAAMLLEASGHQPAGEAALEITVSFEGANGDTVTSVATVRINTIDQQKQQASTPQPAGDTSTGQQSSSSGASQQHQQDLCWVTTTGNTVECLGQSVSKYTTGSVRRVERRGNEGDESD